MFKFLTVILFLATTSLAQVAPISEHYRFGGNGQDGDFTYNGEGSGDCTGAICNGGSCTGTTPNGICHLTKNIAFPTKGGLLNGVLRNYRSVTVDGGTITVDSPGPYGVAVFWLIQGDFHHNNGTIDLKGLGAKGATGGGSPTCSTNGTLGGRTDFADPLPVGDSSIHFGQTGPDAIALATGDPNYVLGNLQLFRFINMIGAGGGTNPQSSQTAALNLSGNLGLPSWGAGGGSGGYCGGSCSDTVGEGGRGGGMMQVEVGGTYYSSNNYPSPSSFVDVRGANGVTGSAGGGGGAFIVTYRNSIPWEPVTDNLFSGGVANNTPPTNCYKGGDGGVGAILFTRLID